MSFNLFYSLNTDPSQIRLIVLDVDGTLTDEGIYTYEQGDEPKKFNAKDGMAIKRLKKNGPPVAPLSAPAPALNQCSGEPKCCGETHC